METDAKAGNQDYAAALRVIGQELADLLPLDLEIAVKEDRFEVTGRGLPESSRGDSAAKKILIKVWHALIHHDPAIDLVDWQLKSVPFARSYSHAELSSWDQDRFKKKRSVAEELPDIYSLGERLRIVGRMVHAKGGKLVQLRKTLNSVTFQYRDRQGVVHSEEYSADDLFRIQQEYYSQRGTGSASLGDS